jgi:dipeptidase
LHLKETLLRVPYVEISQVKKSYAYWASGNADTATGLGIKPAPIPYDNVLVGYNEKGVAISCNWCYSKEDNYPEQGIRRYAIRQLLLERAKSASHGVELIGAWIDKFGQADWGGMQYQLSDSEEAWIVETTSSQWIARKIKDDEIFVAANRFTIGKNFDLTSATISTFAREKGWFDGKVQFHFADVYTLPQRRNSPYDVDREKRVLFLLSPKKGKLTPSDILNVFQDRYEETELFHVPDDNVEIWEAEAEKKASPRPICTNLAQSFFVTEHRAAVEKEESVMFLGLGTPGYSGIIPLYTHNGEVNPRYYSETDEGLLAWRIFRKIQGLTDKDFLRKSKKIQLFWNEKILSVLSRATVKRTPKTLTPISQGASTNGNKDFLNITLGVSNENLQMAEILLEKLMSGESDF